MAPEWNIKNYSQPQDRKVKVIRVTLALLLALTGLTLLLNQVVPVVFAYQKAKSDIKKESELISTVPKDYLQKLINGEVAYFDPDKSYWENLFSAADITGSKYDNNGTVLGEQRVKIDEGYSKSMQLTIESIGINQLNITPNVFSYDKQIYNSVLKKGLAHFKGTPLPGDGGNTFIYGHSAIESFFKAHTNNPETAFTKLPGVEVGDRISIVKDGEVIEYKVRKQKIIEPSDFSVLEQQGGKETLTLMTCWPLGFGTQRLILVAEKEK